MRKRKLFRHRWQGVLLAILMVAIVVTLLIWIKFMTIRSDCDHMSLYRMKIFSVGDTLYYCDHNREDALYAHDMQTGEEVLITEQQGNPYKTNHGYFYIIQDVYDKVYEIRDMKLQLLCEFPEGGEFVDYVDGNIIWTQRRRFMSGDFEHFSKQLIYRKEKQAEADAIQVSEDASEKLYDISDSTVIISEVMLVGDRMYIGQEDGLFCKNLVTGEMQQLFCGIVDNLYTDNEFIVFVAYDEVNGYRDVIHYIEPETGEVKQIKDSPGHIFVMVKDGMVYYDGITITSYNLRTGVGKEIANDSIYDHLGYGTAELYGNTMILRHVNGGFFVTLDVITGEMERFAE